MAMGKRLYQSKKSGLWSPSPVDADRINDHPAWLPEWRKPSPGMILEAMKRIHTTAAETIMIGNANEDYEAAARAGVSFAWADSFFGRAEGRNGNTD